jgi:glutamine amidotransferase-like uncharacterized protein
MKKIIIILSVIIFFISCSGNSPQEETTGEPDNDSVLLQKKITILPDNPKEINVLVFAGDGSPTTRNIEISLMKCNQYNLVDGYYFNVTRVFSTPADKLNINTLNDYDVLLIPGGYPSRMYYCWEKEDIKNWIRQGGGYVGICAGEILAVEGIVTGSIFGDFEGLEIAPGIIRETSNWVGERNIRMTESGAKFLGLSGDQRMMQWNGSGFYIRPDAYEDVVIFAEYFNNSLDREPFEHGSSKWKENFNNKPAVIGLNFGTGRVILAGPHPEENSKFKAFQKAGLLGAMIKWADGDDTPIAFTAGRNEILPETDMSDRLRAMSSIISTDCTLSSINIYIEEGSGRVIAGIYSSSNNQNKPGELLAQSNAYSIEVKSPGWINIPLNNEIEAGINDTIWLAWIFEKYPVITRMDFNLWEGDIGNTSVFKSNIRWEDLNTEKLPLLFPENSVKESLIVSVNSTCIPVLN